MNEGLFRNLSPEEEQEFRDGARRDYIPQTKINPLWHPVYRDECEKINAESPYLADQPGMEWLKELKASWCTQDEHDDTNSFLIYPKDGECTCGVYKHHVHCAHGYIIQIG